MKRILLVCGMLLAVGAGCGDGDGNNGAADCSSPTELTNQNANGGVTISAGSCYRVASRVTVSDGVLTLEPNAQLLFAEGASLVISGDGRLNAVGTADEPIFFTGEEEIRGHWQGIHINSVGSDNVFDYVTIEHGGGDQWTGASNSATSLRINGKLAMTNTTIRESAAYAMQAYGEADISGFADNTFESNEIPAYLHPDRVGEMAGTSTFSDNDDSYIQVTFGNNDAVTVDATWQAFDIPYRVATRTFVDAALTIEAGATLLFNEDVAFIVNPDGGSIEAIGDESNPITFGGFEELRGFWKGIQVRSNVNANVFDYVVVRNAGASQWTGASNSTAALRLEGKLQITNSTFTENDGYALQAYGDADMSGFGSNTFDSNNSPTWLHPDRLGEMAGTSTFTNNDEQFLRVTFGNNDAVSVDATWKDVGVPYRVTTRTFVKAALNVDPGVVVEFAQDVAFIVNDEGSLTTNGESGNTVTFTGADQVQGYWQGIGIATNSSENALTYTNIDYAGSSQWTGASDSVAALYISNAGRVDVANLSITQSGGYAIVVADGLIASCSDVSFADNLEGGVNNKTGDVNAACGL